MKLVLGCCLLVTLGLVSCGGTSGSATVSGTDPASIKAAPAGVSTLLFADLELVRPDNLAGNSPLPTGVVVGGSVPGLMPGLAPQIQTANLTVNPSTLTFTNCKAANGGSMSGTVGVSWSTLTGVTTYVETFNLTVTPAAVNGVVPNQNWTYTGVQNIAVTTASQTAILSVPTALTATFTDNTVTPTVVKVYHITTPSPLQVDWNDLTRISLSGEYAVAESIGANPIYAVSVTISAGTPLLWTTTPVPPATTPCGYPYSGTLALDLTGSLGTDSTTVVFNSTCGDMTIAGANFNLGQ